jgi:hypothetical protein
MITIKIETGNAAFDEGNRRAEVARILRALAAQVEIDHMGPPRDINGNTVGTVKGTGEDKHLVP